MRGAAVVSVQRLHNVRGQHENGAECGETRVYQGKTAVKTETFHCKRHTAPVSPDWRIALRTMRSGGSFQKLRLEWETGKEPVLAPGDTLRGELIVPVWYGWCTFHSINVFLVREVRVRHGIRAKLVDTFKSDKRTLLGRSSSCQDYTCCTLYEGEHTFAFSLTLPLNGLETSMESKNCAVRYLVEAELVEYGERRHVVRRPFTVIAGGENVNNQIQTPIEHSIEKWVDLFPLRSASAPCRARASTDKTFYFPGEWVSLDAIISNGCTWSVSASASLVQTEMVNLNSKASTSRTKLATLKGQPSLVKAEKAVEWHGQRLRVPPTCPSFENSYIKVEYSVEVRITFFDRELLAIFIPIVVKAVPPLASSSGANLISMNNPPGYWSCLDVANIHFLSAGSSNNDWDEADIGRKTFLPQYGYIGDITNTSKITSANSEQDESLPSYVQATKMQ